MGRSRKTRGIENTFETRTQLTFITLLVSLFTLQYTFETPIAVYPAIGILIAIVLKALVPRYQSMRN